MPLFPDLQRGTQPLVMHGQRKIQKKYSLAYIVSYDMELLALNHFSKEA